MPATPSPTTPHNSQQNGFTLFELLVVIVIVSILFTYTTLAIRTDSPADLIKEESQRLERLVELALEESILRGEEYGIEVFIDGYRFLRLRENQWQPLTNDKILRDRELPPGMEMEMSLEETDIVISTSSASNAEKEADLEGSDTAETDTQKATITPHIYLLSSGEITPEFDIRFYISGVKTSYVVNGLFDGTLKAELSDL